MSSAEDLSRRVCTALQFEVGEVEAHAQWVMGQLLDRLGPDDLTAEETMAVVAILAGAHSRKLTAIRNDRMVRALRLVPPLRPPLAEPATGDGAGQTFGDEQAATDLA